MHNFAKFLYGFLYIAKWRLIGKFVSRMMNFSNVDKIEKDLRGINKNES